MGFVLNLCTQSWGRCLKVFTQEDIKNLEFIYHLVKERGFTLEGAKTHLKENKQKTLSRFEIIRKLETVKAELLKIKNQL